MFVVYDDINWGRTSGGQNVEWMFTASPFELKPWAKELLLRWSANDAVSQKERDRNDGVYSQQKNRNPFIDLPDLADYIWGSKADLPRNAQYSSPGVRMKRLHYWSYTYPTSIPCR